MAETEGLDPKEPLTHSCRCKPRELKPESDRVTVQNRFISPFQSAPAVPRKPDPEMAYLTVHDGVWRVSMGVPRELRDTLGSRLVKSTGTKSKAQAKLARDRIVPGFKKRIEDAWNARGGRKGSIVHEALEFRKAFDEAGDKNSEAYQDVEALFQERLRELYDAGYTEVWVDGDAESETPPGFVPGVKPEARREITLFNRVAAGTATPIEVPHRRFVESLKTKARSKLDEPRALALLLDWLQARGIEGYIESVTDRVAIDFTDWLDESTDLSWASKAKYHGRLKFFWAWLVRKQIAKNNPFRELTIQRPETARADDERPYTAEELQRILMGTPLEGDRLLDVVKVAALTGARLDAVVDLKVGGLADGYFTFKPQKRERDERDVPVHPELKEIVARRIKGKSPEDELFPEWPAPPKTSVRPRSAYFSKRFTKYTDGIGVRDEREDKRRSLTNFHSLRRWFITELERARVREGLIAAIVGHKRKGMTLGLYSGGPEFEEAAEAIALVKLPPIDGTPVVERRALSPRRRRQA